MFPKFRRVARTPTVLQMEAVECGAACLGIILSYYKVFVPLAELRAACGVSRDGSKASNIVKAARTYGLNAKGFRKELDQVKDLNAPFVVFWNFRHFVVVEGFKGDQVFLNDPSCGPRRVSIEEFGESFTGVVLIMEPGPDFKRYGQSRSLTNALWQRLKKYPSAAIFSLLLALCLVVPGLLIPMFTKIFVDQYILAQLEQWLRPLLFVMLLTFIIQWLLELSRMRVLRRLATGLSASESARFVWHILHLPVSFYDQRFSGEITNRIALNDRVADLIAGDLALAFLDLLMVSVYSVVLFFFDPFLCAIGVGLSALTLFTLRIVSRKRVDAQRRMTMEVGRAQGIALAGFQSIETLKASGHEGSFFERWAGHYAGSVNAQLKLGMSAMILSVLPTAMQGLTSAIILGVGALRVMDGELSVGDLMAFQLLMTQLQLPVSRFVDLGSRLQELEADLDRIDDVFQAEPDSRSKTEPDYPDWDETKIRLGGRVELKDVSFGYSKVDRPLLKNFNLIVEPGQRVALVGGSGSGKSTAAKLITGLYEPWSGEILFDDTPVEKIPRQVLANSVASVAQSIFLFAGTVRDNLTLWDETVQEDRLEEACRDAAIDEVVRNLPGGFNGELIEAGSNLSGGQRQRLEIARALIPRPSVLILDEATSALDTEIEQVIDRNLRRRGCSTILVSHRLSTVRDCDEIIVLKRGKIVQRGTHEELWKKQKGEYAQLLMSEGGDLPS